MKSGTVYVQIINIRKWCDLYLKAALIYIGRKRGVTEPELNRPVTQFQGYEAENQIGHFYDRCFHSDGFYLIESDVLGAGSPAAVGHTALAYPFLAYLPVLAKKKSDDLDPI